MVALACAHWAKFAAAVGRAVGEESAAKLELPEALANLRGKPTRVSPLPNDVAAVREFIDKTLASRNTAAPRAVHPPVARRYGSATLVDRGP
eukprot:scaffold256735_cov26-Tisochrysis_lutea.AAC.1